MENNNFINEYLDAGKNLTLLNGKIPTVTNWTNIIVEKEKLHSHRGNYGWVIGDYDLVVDVDPRNGGNESFFKLQEDLGIKLIPTVNTPSGGFHCYFKIPAQYQGNKLKKNLKTYPGIDFLTKGNQCVIAGCKTSKGKYTWADRDFGKFEQNDAPMALISLLESESLQSAKSNDNLPTSTDSSFPKEKVLGMLSTLDSSMPYDDWIKVGMALHNWNTVEGLSLWEDWSKSGSNYTHGATAKHWNGFEVGGGITIGTLSYMANQAKSEGTYDIGIIEEAINALETNAGAVFNPKIVALLVEVYSSNKELYQQLRYKIKKTGKCQMPELDKLIKNAIGDDSASSESSTDLIVSLVKEKAELFHNKNKDTFATFENNNHQETWDLHSKGFKEWLGFEFYKCYGMVAKEACIKDAINTLSGNAKYAGEEREIFLRCGTYEGAIYIDLCNSLWQSVKITESGWEVISDAPIRFIRNDNMLSLPMPKKGGGDIEKLWLILNIPNEHRNLLLAWMLECYRCETPFVVLELIGEQGCAKSTTQEYLRSFIDPNKVNLRSQPKSRDDLFVGAYNNWMQSYNNMSHISSDIQDALCVMATGGGYAGRTLFTNLEETVMEVRRPVVINGIGSLATANDLLDRVLHIEPPKVSTRSTEEAIKATFNENKVAIFAGILDLFVETIKALPIVRLVNAPRMADFAKLGVAIYIARGITADPEESFMRDYGNMLEDSAYRALDSSPVAQAVISYMNQHHCDINGTMQFVYEAMRFFAPVTQNFPHSPRGFADALRKCAPGLRRIGYGVDFSERKSDGYHVLISNK